MDDFEIPARRTSAGSLLRAWAALLALGCQRPPEVLAEAGPGAAPAAAADSTAAGGALQAGPARTPERILRCREEESARARGQPGPPIVAPAEPVRLRSTPVDLPPRGCQEAAKRWNLYERSNEVDGCFVNAYVGPSIVVPDLATGLMWASFASSKKVTFEGARQYVQRLNDRKWAGYSDWRLPTTEEFLSILETSAFAYQRHLDPRFFETGLEWWTSDFSSGEKERWVVNTLRPDCDTLGPDYEVLVRAVRTMSKEELEEARRKFEKGD